LESEKEVNLCQTLKLSFAAVKYQCSCALLPYGREMRTDSGNKLLTIRGNQEIAESVVQVVAFSNSFQELCNYILNLYQTLKISFAALMLCFAFFKMGA
jgi:hypothetical protein